MNGWSAQRANAIDFNPATPSTGRPVADPDPWAPARTLAVGAALALGALMLIGALAK